MKVQIPNSEDEMGRMFNSTIKTTKRTFGAIIVINILFVVMLLVAGCLAIKKWLL